MYKCHCGKDFSTHRQLNGHKSIHREGGRYSVSRCKPNWIEHSCLNCQTKFRHSSGTHNKFCSNLCQHAYTRQCRIEKWLATGSFVAVNVPGWVKAYLIETRPKGCEVCSTEMWNGQKLPLECDHKDGNPTNNHIDNLRLICPNCHSLTPSFKGKNRGKGRKHRYKKEELK